MSRADYASEGSLATAGGVIAAVALDSPAARAGLGCGDVVRAIDGTPVTDILDWQWRSDGERMSLEVADAAGSVRVATVARSLDESWGIEFTAPIFDRVRTCRNDCGFCFMTQLPPGMRRSLYLRDDDFRLSFLQGNFVTLTNLGDADLTRIIEQHLSPLYVSLHAVDPEVRAALVCARDDRALQCLDDLLGGGIDVHVQIVLVPGVNDDGVLDQTLTWLAEREGVSSVGVVPLGYTRHQARFARSYESPDAASAVIEQTAEWQVECVRRYAQTWVYLADEFYLNANREVPLATEYDGFPQYENGIGLVRTFIDEWSEARAAGFVSGGPGSREGESVVVTGTLFAPVVRALLTEAGVPARVLAVPNALFGGNVSVAGLLAGADIAHAIECDAASKHTERVYLVPDVVFNADGVTLDGLRAGDLATQTGATVRVVSCDAAGLVAGLAGPDVVLMQPE